jgi:hypothetical protein
MNKPPQFVIAGAPKAGTSSLYEYLKQHPMLFMPRNKEPVFFCNYRKNFHGPGSDDFNRDLVTDPEDYVRLFAEAPDGAVTGEASTDYLSCPQAPLRLKEWNPTVKIVICLRNPIDRAYSEHMHLVRDMLEQEEFAAALRLENERRANGWIPLFWHVERGLYYEAIKRYIGTFGQQNVQVIFHEDLLRSPELVVSDLFKFLGVPPKKVEVTKMYNVSGHPFLKPLQSALLKENRLKTHVKKIIDEKNRTRIKEALLAANIRKKGMPRAEFEYLRTQFDGDISRLQELLQVDLSRWSANQQ